tara:strand:- start:256 stop:618 length:363 start_codon:yes stop_codon:yes gene_type:complete
MSKSESDKQSIFMGFTPSELSDKILDSLEPKLWEKMEEFYSRKDNQLEKPISFAEACDWLGVSRGTLTKLLQQGEIKFKSLNPDNPKSKKLFYISELHNYVQENRNKTINEIRVIPDEKL